MSGNSFLVLWKGIKLTVSFSVKYYAENNLSKVLHTSGYDASGM